MPYLSIHHITTVTRTHSLYKKITTLGASEENDIQCLGPNIQDTHCLIYFDGQNFQIEPVNKKAEVYVNDKRIKKRTDISHNDSIKFGETEASFSMYDEVPQGAFPVQEDNHLAAFTKLEDLARTMAKDYTVSDLLEKIMDSVIDLVNADKGFLLLFENGRLTIKVARNMLQETMLDASGQISDSIVNKVVRTQKPLIISDALNDSEFNASMSVLNLKLCSVMCTPLMDRGTLIGLIYVGNDNIVNLFQPKHLDLLSIFASQTALILANAILVNDLQLKNTELAGEIEKLKFGGIIGNCFAMREVFHTIEKVAPTDVTVLIEGQTGTGKELIAQELHRRSGRSNKPFVVINCGAIPENLLESELFGHVKGAFTGAIQTKEGKFQQANGGTLFLDEIGEMPMPLQVKLLRVIQEKQVMKVGSNHVENVDIRFVAATNKDLEEEVRNGNFRMDLFYRLNVVLLNLPPLSERGDDVLLIARHLLDKYSRDLGIPSKTLSQDAITAIKKYEWPGNIRQLENRLKKALILADKAYITPADLDLTPEMLKPVMSLAEAKDDFQRRYINEVLERNNGNRTKTAKDLGVDPRTIFRHLEKENER